jgi:hypothetical protein
MKKLLITPEGTFEIELNAEEITQRQLDEQQAEQDRLAYEQKKAQEIANKQSALNKLKALGLNDAEINSILGK